MNKEKEMIKEKVVTDAMKEKQQDDMIRWQGKYRGVALF